MDMPNQDKKYNNYYRGTIQVPFSCDSNTYIEILQKYITCDRAYRIATDHIRKLITSCFILGDIYNEFIRVGMPSFDISCDTYLVLPYPDPEKIDVKGNFYRNHNIKISASLDEKILFRANLDIYKPQSRNDIFIECPYPPPTHIWSRYRLRENSSFYSVHNFEYIPPPYGMLPLYINVPFIKDYVRDRLQNPPPPSPLARLIDRKKLAYFF